MVRDTNYLLIWFSFYNSLQLSSTWLYSQLIVNYATYLNAMLLFLYLFPTQVYYGFAPSWHSEFSF